jgi:hypothetical protein
MSVAGELRGNAQKHYERLRRKIREARKCGQLPHAQDEIDRTERVAAALRELYRQRKQDRENLELALEKAEKEAASLGLDVSGDNLVPFYQNLERTIEHIGLLTHMPADFVFSSYINQGVNNADDAIASYTATADSLPLLSKKLKLVKTISHLRFVLGK